MPGLGVFRKYILNSVVFFLLACPIFEEQFLITWLIWYTARDAEVTDRLRTQTPVTPAQRMTEPDGTAGFQKNEYWASCKTSCTAGIDPADPPEYATPWTCKARRSSCSSQALGLWDFVGFPTVSSLAGAVQDGVDQSIGGLPVFRALPRLSCATNSLP